MRSKVNDNPFHYTVDIKQHEGLDWLKKIVKLFPISWTEAKVIYYSSQEFNEQFCREHIAGIKSRGGSEYGAKTWLRRKYKLEGDTLNAILRDFWDNPADKMSGVFFEVMSAEYLAAVRLTEDANADLKRLKKKYSKV